MTKKSTSKLNRAALLVAQMYFEPRTHYRVSDLASVLGWHIPRTRAAIRKAIATGRLRPTVMPQGVEQVFRCSEARRFVFDNMGCTRSDLIEVLLSLKAARFVERSPLPPSLLRDLFLAAAGGEWKPSGDILNVEYPDLPAKEPDLPY